MYNTRVSGKVNYGLGVTITYHTPPTPLCPRVAGLEQRRNLIMGRFCFVWGQRYTGNLYLPLKFAVNLKLL